MSEKMLVGIEIGAKGTVNMHVDSSLTTKEAILTLLSMSLQIGCKQGLLDGSEVSLNEIVNKLN